MLTISQLKAVYEQVKTFRATVHLIGNELELGFTQADQKTQIENLLESYSVATDSFSPTSLSFKSELGGLLIYDQLDTLLDQLNLDIALLDSHDIFVFDVEGFYLHYVHQSKHVNTNSPQAKIRFLLPHFKQYKTLLDIYLGAEGSLYEIKRTSRAGSEFVVLSKGEKKLVTSINYKVIDKTIFVEDNVSLPIDDFRAKILSEEWLACYNETLCQFMDAQIPQRRTFSMLFNNFTYLLNLTAQNFQLYILKFSFDKIRKQFKTEKNTYFENLNTAQDKISGQIISVPISLGASIFSFYQFNASPLILTIIYIAIWIYAVFIGFVVVMNLYDIKKIATDANEEEQNLREHYQDLHTELIKDFAYMKNKRLRVRFLAWAIIVALLITLTCLTVFLLNYQDAKTNTIHFL
jgi:hypothetical protein